MSLSEAAFKGRHVFIDDHVEHDRSHIVDVRDVRSGHQMAFGDVVGRHLLRAEPFWAIGRPDYYVDKLRRIIEDVTEEDVALFVHGLYEESIHEPAEDGGEGV